MNEDDVDVRPDRKINAAVGGRGPALGTDCRPGQDGGRSSVVFGVYDRRLLQAVVPFAHGQSQQCSAPRPSGERKSYRLPALQTVQSRRPFDRVRECSSRREGLQNNRGERRGAVAGGAGGRGRSQPNLFPKATTGVTPKDY